MKEDKTFASIAVLKAKKGKEEEVRKELLAMIEPTRKEAGCIEYILFEDFEKAGEFYMREAFNDKEAFDFHIATPHFQALAMKFETLLAEPPNIIRIKRISS